MPEPFRLSLVVSLLLVFVARSTLPAQQAVPDKLVVLTFDDSSRSHYDVARPILKKYGFSATFFITEGFNFATNKKDYMTWEEIAVTYPHIDKKLEDLRQCAGVEGAESLADRRARGQRVVRFNTQL